MFFVFFAVCVLVDWVFWWFGLFGWIVLLVIYCCVFLLYFIDWWMCWCWYFCLWGSLFCVVVLWFCLGWWWFFWIVWWFWVDIFVFVDCYRGWWYCCCWCWLVFWFYVLYLKFNVGCSWSVCCLLLIFLLLLMCVLFVDFVVVFCVGVYCGELFAVGSVGFCLFVLLFVNWVGEMSAPQFAAPFGGVVYYCVIFFGLNLIKWWFL